MGDLGDSFQPVEAGGPGGIQLFIGLCDIQIVFHIAFQRFHQFCSVFGVIGNQFPDTVRMVKPVMVSGVQKRHDHGKRILIELIQLLCLPSGGIVGHQPGLADIKPDL